jgi:AcrR family transcriptional regulator
MPRPPDPERRTRTLSKAADYVLDRGLEGLSLRPLAAALGTSTRMLLYDFGSKEQLIEEVLAEIRRREAGLLQDMQARAATGLGEMLESVWEWVTAQERAPFMRVFFQTYVDAMTHPEAYAEGGRPMVGDWVSFLTSPRRPDPVDPATATLFVAVIRGLLFDRLTAADPDRTDSALKRFTDLLQG